MNTAIDSDDGNLPLRNLARRALDKWLDRLTAIAAQGQKRGEIRRQVDSAKLATLIVSTLEGSLMLSRLQRTEEPLDVACRYLDDYLGEKFARQNSQPSHESHKQRARQVVEPTPGAFLTLRSF